MKRLGIISFAAMAWLLVLRAGAQDFEVRLQRPLAAGDAHGISVTARQTRITSVSANRVQQQNVRTDINEQLDAAESVVAVDAHGKETQITLTVEKFTFAATGHPVAEVLPKGTVVSCAVAEKKQVYTVDGKPATADVAKALDLVVDLSTGEPSKDEDFGTSDKKKKGESWEVNGANVKKALESSGSGYEFSNISGKAGVDDVTPAIMTLSVHFHGDVKLPVPQYYVLDAATIDATYHQVCPADTSKYQAGDSEDIVIAFTSHSGTQPNLKITAKSSIEKVMTRVFTPAK